MIKLFERCCWSLCNWSSETLNPFTPEYHHISHIFSFSHHVFPPAMAAGFVSSMYRLSDFLRGLIDFPGAAELPTQQLSLFVKTSAHSACHLQWVFLPAVGGELGPWHQLRLALWQLTHWTHTEEKFESQRDIVFGTSHVWLHAPTSAAGDFGP